MARLISLLLLIIVSIHAQNNLKYLLQKYKNESELSKKTKKEEAGILYVYTREMLERMQVKNLRDILKSVPGLNLYTTMNNISLISAASSLKLPFGSIRIFINDHDMSSAYFGSSFLIWGDLNLEYIDHIEIYKATSSIEFGNETTPLIIKLYTKLSDREIGGKIRATKDHKNSFIFNLYKADILNDDFSYFVYGNFQNIDNKDYHNIFNNKLYKLSKDKNDFNFYTNFLYKKWLIEFGSMVKNTDNFLGYGLYKTPKSGGLKTGQKYIHITKNLKNSIKLQFSYDRIDYDQKLYDPNGIAVFGLPRLATNYNTKLKDDVYTVSAMHTLELKKHKFLYGGFYKYKKNIKNIDISTESNLSNSFIGSSKNSVHYNSFFIKDRYHLTKNIDLLASFKKDILNFKNLKKCNRNIYKISAIYKNSNFSFQVYYTHLYLPLSFYFFYPLNRLPNFANKGLTSPTADIYQVKFKYFIDKGYISLTGAKRYIKDPVVFVHIGSNPGFINLKTKTKYSVIELAYSYEFDFQNSFDVAIYTSNNYQSLKLSPKKGAIIRIFNHYKNFDIYNEFIYKSSYKPYGIKVDSSLDWTSSIKYKIDKDFYIGIRGENILNSGLKQVYNNLPFLVSEVEQKFWINLEYLF